MSNDDLYPPSVPKQAWYLHLDSGITYANSIEPPIPSIPRGESETYTFRFYTDHYAGQDPPPPNDHLDRYRHLLELNDHAGSYVGPRETASNLQTYMEQIPASAESLLVKVEPSYPDKSEVQGIWGLLNSVTDETQDEHAVVHLEMDLTKLCDAEEYDSHAELRSDLENGGP